MTRIAEVILEQHQRLDRLSDTYCHGGITYEMNHQPQQACAWFNKSPGSYPRY